MADYVKLPEVARRLGVSERTARRMVKAGKLPAIFIGNAYRVDEDDIATYLEGARVDPGKAPRRSPYEPSFNDVLEEERRAELEEVERFVGFALARADYWTRDLERGRDEEYATADGAYKLAVRALEEFSDIYGWLYDRVAHDLLVAMEEGGGVSREAEEAYDALHSKLLTRTTETQRALFDRAESLAETRAKRDELAKKRRETEAAADAKVVRLFPSPRRDQVVSAGEARRRVERGAEAG